MAKKGLKEWLDREMGRHRSTEEERQVSAVPEEDHQGEQKENIQNAFHLQKPHE